MTPEAALTQRLDALERANETRIERALEACGEGRRCVGSLTAAGSPACLQTAKVHELLMVMPRYGRVRVDRILSRCRIPSSKTVGGLSGRQRYELVLLLPVGSGERAR